MMETIKQVLIRYAVKLAAAGNLKYETLHEATTNLLYGNTALNIDSADISRQISYDTCSHLFFDYGLRRPEKIRNASIVKQLFAEIWYLTYIARNYEQLTFLELKSQVAKKFSLERGCDSRVTEEKYATWLLKTFSTTGLIKEYGKELFSISHFAEEALKNMHAYFEKVLSNKQFLEIYKLSELDTEPKKSKEPTAVRPNVLKNNLNNSESITDTEIKELNKVIKSLKSDKRLLETRVHKLQVDMEHMKRDIIREVLSDLTNPAYGYPLSELYLYTKEENLPEAVRGTIRNLFSTLGNVGVKLLKTTELGDTLIFDEQASEIYDVYKYHEFKIGDEVYVCYPGYRYERETIIQPTVKRKDV